MGSARTRRRRGARPDRLLRSLRQSDQRHRPRARRRSRGRPRVDRRTRSATSSHLRGRRAGRRTGADQRLRQPGNRGAGRRRRGDARGQARGGGRGARRACARPRLTRRPGRDLGRGRAHGRASLRRWHRSSASDKVDRMRAVSALSTLLAGVLLAGCSPKASGSSAAAPAGAAPRNVPAARPLTAAERLERGQRALRQSDYERAEADLRATAVGAERAQALLSLAELYLTTGRYDEAAKGAERARAAGAAAHEAAWIEGEALRRQGKLAEARASLEAV